LEVRGRDQQRPALTIPRRRGGAERRRRERAQSHQSRAAQPADRDSRTAGRHFDVPRSSRAGGAADDRRDDRRGPSRLSDSAVRTAERSDLHPPRAVGHGAGGDDHQLLLTSLAAVRPHPSVLPLRVPRRTVERPGFPERGGAVVWPDGWSSHRRGAAGGGESGIRAPQRHHPGTDQRSHLSIWVRLLMSWRRLILIVVFVVGAEETPSLAARQPAFRRADSAAHTSLAIIVNAQNPVRELSLADLRRILLGEMTRWPDGRR